MFAPLYLFKRADNPFENAHLPVAVAGVFKIMLDVPTTIDLMLMTLTENRVPISDFRAIREFADVNLILLNGEYACAGSPALMDEALQVLFDKAEPGWNSDPLFCSYFPRKLEFLRFLYYMCCQYIISLIYQLSVTYAMEFAFTDLVRARIYKVLATDEKSRLSAYERRRRIALAALIGSSDPGRIFAKLARLVENEGHWQLPIEARFDIGEFVEESGSFSRFAATASAIDILSRHHTYAAKLHDWLKSCQRKIEDAIGAKVFPDDLVMGPSPQVPVTVLSQVIAKCRPESQQRHT
jgi:hypothetical protein